MPVTVRQGGAYPAGKVFPALDAKVHTGDETRVMVLPQVHHEQLLLPEVLVAVEAGEWLLSRVCAHVCRQAALLGGKQEHG